MTDLYGRIPNYKRLQGAVKIGYYVLGDTDRTFFRLFVLGDFLSERNDEGSRYLRHKKGSGIPSTLRRFTGLYDFRFIVVVVGTNSSWKDTNDDEVL